MMLIDAVTSALLPFAIGWFVLLMSLRTAVVLRRGYKVELGMAKGHPRRGVLYSLTFSMLPWKKDSIRRHPWTYLAGMGMHLGILFTLLFHLGLRFWIWPQGTSQVLGAMAGVGLAGALGLCLKRLGKPYMRVISSPDDFLSNLAVQFYLLGGLLTALDSTMVPVWRAGAILLLFYAPLGKIYHMLLFFVARTLFGLQFGRRGVLRHDIPVSY